jgi:S-formylglutathione hydrolase FrmB
LSVVYGQFRSRHVRGDVGYAIAWPANLDPHTIDGAAYLLPGRGGTARDAMDDFGAFYSRMKHGGYNGSRFALVAVDAGESYFHPRASGEDRLALVVEELPVIAARATGERPRREALLGVSMGGYGALLAYERAASRYRAVAVAGPALFTSYANERASVGDAFDSAADFARHDVVHDANRLLGTNVYVRCGDSDPFAPAVRAFAKRCPHADVRIVPGCHTGGFWRATAPDMLGFVARSLHQS